MIIEANENGIKRSSTSDEFALAYKSDLSIIGLEFSSGILIHTGSMNELEVFTTAQEMADRAVELGLDIKIEHMISALEYGVELTEPRKSYFWDNVWIVGTDEEKERLNKLGYEA